MQGRHLRQAAAEVDRDLASQAKRLRLLWPARLVSGRRHPSSIGSFCAHLPTPRKATLADIVEQLQEKEAGPGLPVGVS